VPAPHALSAPSRALVATLILIAALAALCETSPAKAATSPFEKLSGDWTGGGTVTPKDGPPKKVTCKANYKVTGSNLSQNLSCTGTDYEIDAKLKLTDKGGKVKGTWTETIYDAAGAVTGSAKENLIHALIRGDKFSGRMSLKLTDTGLSINIVQRDEKSGIYRLVTSLFLRR